MEYFLSNNDLYMTFWGLLGLKLKTEKGISLTLIFETRYFYVTLGVGGIGTYLQILPRLF